MHIAKIRDRRRKRKYFNIQIPQHLKELDKWLGQRFRVGNKVKVKFRGDTNTPSWPAEIIGIGAASFKVKWTSEEKVPPGEQVGKTFSVHNERYGASKQYRCVHATCLPAMLPAFS